MAGAASTHLLTAAGGTQSIEALLRQPAFKENFRQWFKAVAAGSVKEGLREEAPDQLIQGIIERYTYNPDKPWKDIIEETLQAGIGGALLGGASEATTTGLAPAKTSQDQPQPPIPLNTTPVGRPSTQPLSVEQSQKLIHNVMNRPPEQRGHPTTQADLAQAQWVVREQVRKLESQKEPLSDVQQRELAEAKAALARVEPSAVDQQKDSELPGNGEKPVEEKRHLTGTTRESIDHKLDTYLLNPEHKIGGPKAKWFKEALGFTRENASHLADQLVFDPQTAVATDKTQHGQKYEQIIYIHGANGKTIPVVMVWIRNLDGVVRYVTAIPTKQKND